MSTFNAARFDFVTLRLFCAVAQSGSITQGAQICHLALSAASRRLSEFETATGSQLMERSKKGVTLSSLLNNSKPWNKRSACSKALSCSTVS
jgi:molybdenum-dependent DNA-binding transcriptional regulator ModE